MIVAQAEVQLTTTQAEATALRVARAQYEHAIALLIGARLRRSRSKRSPAILPTPPSVPPGIPSELLERRPDIAAAERAMAAANAQIGVAIAAFYPNLTLSGSVGAGRDSVQGLLQLQMIWSLGASVAQTVFDAGLRSATVDQYKAAYDQNVATYRQTVLTAFQQVEDGLSGLQVLSRQLSQQQNAVRSSERYVRIATNRWRLGVDPYLNVITAQVALSLE